MSLQIMDNQTKDYFSASFRIIGSELDPVAITEEIGINPDENHKKGDPNTGKTKSGKIVEYAPFRAGMWSISSQLDKSCGMQEHIQNIIERLEPKREVLVRLRVAGFKMDVYCGYFFSMKGQPWITLTNDLLKRLAELQVDINIDLYPA